MDCYFSTMIISILKNKLLFERVKSSICGQISRSLNIGLFWGIGIASSLLPFSSTKANEKGERWYVETLYPEWQQVIRMDQVLKQEKTEFQDLVIFENGYFGRVMALDGVIQTTQADEFIYHEMMVHIPLIAHGNAEQVLIIGGGDGGALREVVRHKNVKKIVLVEIDHSVVDLSKQYLPTLSNGAFNDPRLELVICDGAEYVKNTKSCFDVIICDSTDPMGSAEVLFSEEFYGNCKKILNEKGIFVNQNGVPFMQIDEAKNTYQRRKNFFKDSSFYVAPVPTYVGGFMAFGYATDELSYRDLNLEEINARLQQIEGELKYYNAEIHRAAFALPNFVKKLVYTNPNK
jgi:spermidine synthase